MEWKPPSVLQQQNEELFYPEQEQSNVEQQPETEFVGLQGYSDSNYPNNINRYTNNLNIIETTTKIQVLGNLYNHRQFSSGRNFPSHLIAESSLKESATYPEQKQIQEKLKEEVQVFIS